MSAKEILKDIAERYDRAKRSLKFTDVEFAKAIGYTPEYFSNCNKQNFENSSITMLQKIHEELEKKGF